MANPENFLIAGNDEHGIDPPTAGKRTPKMPYINRSFYENEFNFPTKNYFLADCARIGYNVYDVKPELYDVTINNRVSRVNTRKPNAVVTFAYNATQNENFNSWKGLEVYYSPNNVNATQSYALSQQIYASLVTNGYVRGNFIGKLNNVGMLSSVRVLASLCECGYMTNFEEAKMMVDPDFQNLMGSLACKGVGNYFGVPYKTPQETVYPFLKLGSRGSAVQYLQLRLINYGYRISSDGVFGANTDTAVKQFQQLNGLAVDGMVGNNTWVKINNFYPSSTTLRQGSRGVEVWYLQAKLLSKLYPVSVDGIFGAGTLAQVQEFQKENGLSPDGIVGRATWAKVTPIGGGRPLPT